MIPMLGVSIGMILAKYMPWVEPERWGPVVWKAHLKGILVFAIPNAFIIASILFAIAVLARNEIVSFVGAIVLLVALHRHRRPAAKRRAPKTRRHPRSLWHSHIRLRHEILDRRRKEYTLGRLLRLYALESSALDRRRHRYFCLRVLPLQFHRAKKEKAVPLERSSRDSAFPSSRCPKFRFMLRPSRNISPRSASISAAWSRAPSFIVILLLALTIAFPPWPSMLPGLRQPDFPVTYWVLEIIAGSFYMFLVAIITYYAGVLVWKDRDTRMDEITDSLPTPEWVSYASRLTALIGLILHHSVLSSCSRCHRAGRSWLSSLPVRSLRQRIVLPRRFALPLPCCPRFFYSCSFAQQIYRLFLVHRFSSRQSFRLAPTQCRQQSVKFANRPRVIYSDFYGDAPFRSAWGWYALYWLLFCGFLSSSVLFWPRGKQASGASASAMPGCVSRAFGPCSLVVGFMAFAAVGAWAYYNTEVLNHYNGPKDDLRLPGGLREDLQAACETTDAAHPQSQIRHRDFPRAAQHHHARRCDHPESLLQPVDEIHFTLNRHYDTTIEIPGADARQG